MLRAIALLCISFCLIIGFTSPAYETQQISSIQSQAADSSRIIPKRPLLKRNALEPTQQWTINSSETRENEVITTDALIVERNASLMLINCTLMINSTQDSTGIINIHGTLILRNQTIVKAADPSFHYIFIFFSTSACNASDSTIRDVGESNLLQTQYEGIYLKCQQALFRNMTISNCWNGFIVVSEDPIRIENCRIIDNAVNGIRLIQGGGKTLLDNNLIERNGRFTDNFQIPGAIIIDENYRKHTGQLMDNCTIRSNIIRNNKHVGIGARFSENITIVGNYISNQTVGILLDFCDNFRVEANEIIADIYGSGIRLTGGCRGNLIRQNIIQIAKYGIEIIRSSPNALIENQINETSDAAILMETCVYGDTISFNELSISSGVSMKITEANSGVIEGNKIIASDDYPVFLLEDTENCSFIANQISAQGAIFYLQDSSNDFFSENRVTSSSSGEFLLATGQSKNITLAIFDMIGFASIEQGSTLKFVPKAAIKPEIALMTLYSNDNTFANADASNLELILPITNADRGNKSIVVEVLFHNNTKTNWTFSIVVLGRHHSLVTSTSDASWYLLIPLTLGMQLLVLWKKRNKTPSNH
ncbi:MAG: right-handed parallel beta-helix repeat-containing protein [Candidatus Hodarchaeales archaeon]